VLVVIWGWRGAFYLNAALGLVWVALWLALYRNPPIRPENEDVITDEIGWMGALKYQEAWGFALGKFLTDGVWWFYLFWLPPYLCDVRHFNLRNIGWSMPVLYSAASLGSLFGGEIPSYLGRRGWNHAQGAAYGHGHLRALYAYCCHSSLGEEPNTPRNATLPDGFPRPRGMPGRAAG
jgi:ACS family hexuronate transporter-like MFS transporter